METARSSAGVISRWIGSPGDGTRLPRLLAAGTGVGPDFLCVGAQKGGTGWLFDQVNLHPDFWMPPVKELHYFNQAIHLEWIEPLRRRARWGLWRVNRRRDRSRLRRLTSVDLDVLDALAWLKDKPLDLDLYARLFNPKGGLISGDCTPTYSVIDDGLIARIMGRFPRLKVVFIAREPVERFWSNYCMICRQRQWPLTSDWAQIEEFIRTSNAVRHSRVSEVVAHWRRATPEGQFGFHLFDDLLGDAVGMRRRLLSFLGADPDKASGGLPADFNRKSNDPKIPMSEEARERLVGLFADELRASAAAFGGAAAAWPARYGV